MMRNMEIKIMTLCIESNLVGQTFFYAGSLAFTHPFSNQELILKSSFPDDWIQLFEKFYWKNPLK